MSVFSTEGASTFLTGGFPSPAKRREPRASEQRARVSFIGQLLFPLVFDSKVGLARASLRRRVSAGPSTWFAAIPRRGFAIVQGPRTRCTTLVDHSAGPQPGRHPSHWVRLWLPPRAAWRFDRPEASVES